MLSVSRIYLDHALVGASLRSHVCAGDAPRVSWAARCSRSHAVQSAYRLAVGDWDSGWVASGDMTACLPAGTLPPGRETSLTLSIRDDAGEESAPMTVSVWNGAVTWDAPWVGDPAMGGENALYLQKTFTLPAAARSARLYATGMGYFTVAINGTAPDDARLDPAFSDFSRTVYYVLHPRTEGLLQAGENTLRAILAPGWRNNLCMHKNDWVAEKFTFDGDLAFSCILEAELVTGETVRITTGEGWEAGSGPIGEASLFDGETYDASVAPMTGAHPAVVLPAPGGEMRPMVIPPIREQTAHAPVASWPDGEDAVILDFGINLAGVIRLPLPAGLAAGQRITLAHTEELTEDGRLFSDTLRFARATDTYIAAGDGRDPAFWQPVFNYHGFRYARIEGLGAAWDPADVRAVELRTDIAHRSFFRCGDPLVTRIHEIAAATERANIHSILTDCPQRDERMGWMNDATVRFEETPYNFDVGAIFPKVLRDLVDTQLENGGIGCTAPYMTGGLPADPVCTSFLVAARSAGLFAGNLDTVKTHFTALEGWENYLLSQSEDCIVTCGILGDWASPVDCCRPRPDGPGTNSALTPEIFMSTGFSLMNCQLLAEMAGWLGDADSAARWSGMADRIASAMRDKWLDAETGSFATGSQGCLAFALRLGIAPDPARTAARLREAVAAAGGRITTGNLCTRYILDALADHGALEDAWALVTRQEYPSWGYMIQNEATTVWERFELMKSPAMNSHNHPMYGAMDGWLFDRIIGLVPTAPGFTAFRVAPMLPEGLLSAQAVVDTPLGEISVRWTRRYGGRHIQVAVPFGARAEIVFGGETHTVGSGFHAFSVAE